MKSKAMRSVVSVVLGVAASICLAATQVSAALSVSVGLESSPPIGATDWSADIVDEFGDAYHLRITSGGRSGPLMVIAARWGEVGYIEGRGYVTDRQLSGWAAGLGVSVPSPPPWDYATLELTALYRSMRYEAGRDYVRPAYAGDPGMFLVDATGKRWFIETGTPVRLEGERRFLEIESSIHYRIGQLSLGAAAGWMLGGPTEMRALAKAVAYPETDVRLSGAGQVGSPNWSGLYWRVSIGGEW